MSNQSYAAAMRVYLAIGYCFLGSLVAKTWICYWCACDREEIGRFGIMVGASFLLFVGGSGEMIETFFFALSSHVMPSIMGVRDWARTSQVTIVGYGAWAIDEFWEFFFHLDRWSWKMCVLGLDLIYKSHRHWPGDGVWLASWEKSKWVIFQSTSGFASRIDYIVAKNGKEVCVSGQVIWDMKLKVSRIIPLEF